MSIKDDIEQFHEKKICYKTKTYALFGEITEEKKVEAILNLHLLDDTSGEITILLSSEGGDVPAGLDIIDAIRAMKNHVRIIAYGEVGSMASVIFQAADTGRRYMMPSSNLMLHEGEAGVIGSKKNRAQYTKLQDWHEKKCIDLYLSKIKEKKTNYTKRQLTKQLEKDWILFPEEAIAWGLADEILEVY